jgi:hypothetical protein
MSPSAGRTSACGPNEARTRLTSARAFVSVAELVYAEPDDPVLPHRGVAAALAVLGGIAASDAICCMRLGRVPRGDDHDQAVSILETAMPEGPRVKNDLLRLLGVKDKVHYQAILVSSSETEAAIKQARRLLAAAESAVAR